MSTGSSERADSTHPTEDIKNKARQVSQEAKSVGKEQLDRYRGTGADELARVAQSVKVAASDLERDRPGLSRYVATMADGMERLADDMRAKSVDDLFRDVNRIARDNPGLFIAGSVAIGFGLMRFAKASSQRSPADYERHPLRDRLHRNVDEHERGDMASQALGEGYIPDQDELNSHISSGEPGGTVGSVSNAGGMRTTSKDTAGTGRTAMDSGVSVSTTRTTTTLDTTTSTARPVTGESGVTTRSDPRIRSAGTTPANVNRDGKNGGLQP